jgi:Flp pilus assembly protein TadG
MIKNMMKNWLQNTRGAIAVEFVLIAPIIILMLIGGFEVGRYVMIMNKTQSAAFTLATVVSQTSPATVLNTGDGGRLNEENLRNILNGIDTLMEPFSVSDDARGVVVTSVQHEDAGNVVRWQASVGQSFEGAVSIVNGGTPGGGVTSGGVATFDGSINSELSLLKGGENVMVLELFYRYQPVFAGILGKIATPFKERTITKRVFFYNRLGKALFLPPSVEVTGGGSI